MSSSLSSTSSPESLLTRAEQLLSEGDESSALQIFSAVIRMPFVSALLSFKARLGRAKGFISMAKGLQAKSAREGEMLPQLGVDLTTWCEMAISNCDELIQQSYTSVLQEEKKQQEEEEETETDENEEEKNNTTSSSLVLLEQAYITRAVAAKINGDHLTTRRYAISGLCEFPESKELRKFLIKEEEQEVGNENEKDQGNENNNEEDETEKTTSASPPKSSPPPPARHQDPITGTSLTSLTDISSADLHLECAICQCLYVEPITLSCGHTFDRSCLASTMDHAASPRSAFTSARGGGAHQQCPLCRTTLHVDVSTFPINLVLHHIVQTLFPAQYRERKKEVESDEVATLKVMSRNNSNNDKDDNSATEEKKPQSRRTVSLPLFVCNSSSPGHSVAFNIFEPRYRLMFRRCIRGSREFCLVEHREISSDQENEEGSFPFYQVGTLVKINDSVIQSDGRITISGVSTRRVRVISNSEVDGYRVGVCEDYEDDDPKSDEECVAAATAVRLLLKKLLEKISSSSQSGRAPPFCTELVNAPMREQKEEKEEQEEQNEKSDSNKDEETKKDSSVEVVDMDWAKANFTRVVVPASLWLGEFYFPASWQNCILTSTMHRVKMCLNSHARMQRGSFLASIGSSTVSYLRSSFVGRIFGLNDSE